MNYDGKVVISTALDNSGLKKSLQNISGSFGGLKSVLGQLTGMIATAFSVTAVIQFGVASSKAAMQLENALIGLQSIVEGQGRSFSKAKTFIEEYTKDGLIPATNAITAYKNLASRGYDDSQIQQTMIALKNASAFGRQSSLSMGEAVLSATEGLKNENSILVDNAGVTKNVAKMWDEYAKSIGTTAQKLTQQQKIQAEVTGILEESKYQAGDAAKVAGTLSGQLQQLSFNFNNLKIAVGNIINPIANVVVPVLNTAVAAITRFANTLAAVSASLFGVASKSMDSYTASVKDAADAEKDLANGIAGASKAAKKALAGFDELNVLQDKSSGSGTAGGISGENVQIGGNVDDQLTDQAEGTSAGVQRIIEKIQDLIEPLKNIDLTPAKKAFSQLGDAIADFGGIIAEKLEGAWHEILVPLAGWCIEDAVPAMLDLCSDAFDTLGSVVDVIFPTLESFWNDFLSPLSEWAMTDLIPKVVNLIGAAFNFLGAVVRDTWPAIHKLWTEFLQPIAKWAANLAGGILETILTNFANGLNHFAQVINYTASEAYILSDAEKELAKSAQLSAENFSVLQEATAKEEDAISKEIGHYSKLYEELDRLVGAQGKVAENDEARVKFILNELRDGLGVEAELIDGIITGYGNLREAILKTIAAKKAELLLKAHEDDYLAALESQQEAWDQMKVAESAYLAQRKQFIKKQAEVLADIRLSGDRKTEIIQAELAALANMRTAYDEAQDNYKGYVNTINSYEMAHQMVLEESYEKAADLLLDKNTAYTEHTDHVETETERAINAMKRELSDAERIAEQTKFGFEHGIVGFTEDMVNEAYRAVDDTEKKLSELVAKGKGFGSGLGGKLAEGMGQMKQRAAVEAKDLSDAALGAIDAEKAQFEEAGAAAGKKFTGGLTDTVNAAAKSISKSLKSLAKGIPTGGSGLSSFVPTTATTHDLATADIPYLARGSVIPPNAPFMAVLGDQRHGTNIEAPLTTIQEAVANVMNENISAMMAGFEALLEENRQLRQVVEGIEVGDATIGEAVNRYNRKMAVVRGG